MIMQQKTRFYYGFVKMAGAVLMLTCLAKLISVFGSAEALRLPDPLFGLQSRKVMLLSALVEAFVVCVLLGKATPSTKLASVLWLSLNFANYRISLWLMGVGAPCPCMGSIYGLLGVDSGTMNRVLGGIVVALLVGSGYLMWQLSHSVPQHAVEEIEPNPMARGK